MKTAILGKHKKEYLILVNRYAKRLEANEIVVRKSGAIDIYCEDGIVCENYIPTSRELYG